MIDTFSTLDDIPAQLSGHELEDAIVKTLRVAGRFSIFEATASLRMAHALTRLEKTGRIKSDSDKFGYPWIAAEVIR
jgi:hypothetical protein